MDSQEFRGIDAREEPKAAVDVTIHTRKEGGEHPGGERLANIYLGPFRITSPLNGIN